MDAPVTHQRALEPATDSDLQRWLEEAQEARIEQDLRALPWLGLGWLIALLLAIIWYGGLLWWWLA